MLDSYSKFSILELEKWEKNITTISLFLNMIQFGNVMTMIKGLISKLVLSFQLLFSFIIFFQT